MKNYILVFLTSSFILIGLSIFGQGVSWTQWRGPSGDGSTTEVNWSAQSINKPNSVLWRTNVGMGHSAVSVDESRLYTFGNYELEDSVFKDKIVCLDSNTGEEIWSYSYICAEGEDPGPLSSPLLENDCLYVISREGHFISLNAISGKLIWERHLVNENLAQTGFGHVSSPIIYKNLIVLNIAKNGAAFNKETGELIWKSGEGKDNFSSPVVVKNEHKDFLIMQLADETYAVDPLNGEIIWELEGGAISDPMIYDNKLLRFVYKGISCYNIDGEPKLLWKNEEVKSSFQSYVINGDYAYGFGGQGKSVLQCVNLKDGTILWNSKLKQGALILSNDILIVLDYNGKLVFVEADPVAYKEISSIQAFDMPKTDNRGKAYRRVSACWTNPVLSYGKLYLEHLWGFGLLRFKKLIEE